MIFAITTVKIRIRAFKNEFNASSVSLGKGSNLNFIMVVEEGKKKKDKKKRENK